MRQPLLLALLALSALPSHAEDATALPQGQAREAPPAPAPQLMHLERTLMRKQEARNKGTLPPAKYQEFVAQFRAELDAVMGRITPTPENKGLHAQILARLGEQELGQAVASLDQALVGNPENPALLVAKGSILHEQKDYPAAAALAQQAWEASGRTDKRAWALLKMSEGRTAGGRTGEPAPRLQPAADFARLEWSIPENNDINPRAMGFIQQAIAARRKGDMGATASNAQAAMNADPTSAAVQELYGIVQANQSKHADTLAYVGQAAESMHAGRGPEAIAPGRRRHTTEVRATTHTAYFKTCGAGAQSWTPSARKSLPRLRREAAPCSPWRSSPAGVLRPMVSFKSPSPKTRGPRTTGLMPHRMSRLSRHGATT